MSKYMQNGICEVIDSSNAIHYLMMTENDFEAQLTRKLSEFGYSDGFNYKDDKMAISMRI